MFFIRDRKAGFFFYLLLVCCVGVLFIAGFYFGRQWSLNECEYKENIIKIAKEIIEEEGPEKGIISEEKQKTDIVKDWPQEELDKMLITIQKKYIFDQWYHQYENELVLKVEDLEKVYFYQDEKGTIYFLSVSMVNKIVKVNNKETPIYEFLKEGVEKYGLFWCKYYKTEWKRLIYPEPDNRYTYFYWLQDISEKIEGLRLIGSAEAPISERIPDRAFESELYENEYTDAVVDIIHSYFYRREKYGEYRIYIGYYGVCNTDSLLSSEYNMTITVAIIPKGGEVKNGMWWIFRAKDIPDENGKVVVETDGGAGHSSPIPYDYYNETYAPRIEMIVNMNRLVIPLTITESDEVKELGCFKDEDDLNTIHYYLK